MDLSCSTVNKEDSKSPSPRSPPPKEISERETSSEERPSGKLKSIFSVDSILARKSESSPIECTLNNLDPPRSSSPLSARSGHSHPPSSPEIHVDDDGDDLSSTPSPAPTPPTSNPFLATHVYPLLPGVSGLHNVQALAGLPSTMCAGVSGMPNVTSVGATALLPTATQSLSAGWITSPFASQLLTGIVQVIRAVIMCLLIKVVPVMACLSANLERHVMVVVWVRAQSWTHLVFFLGASHLMERLMPVLGMKRKTLA